MDRQQRVFAFKPGDLVLAWQKDYGTFKARVMEEEDVGPNYVRVEHELSGCDLVVWCDDVEDADPMFRGF